MAATLPARPPAACKRVPFHPLELLPFATRWRPSLVRDLVYTVIFNALMATLFLVLNLVFDDEGTLARILDPRFLWVQFVIAQSIGFSIYFLIRLVDRVFLRDREATPLSRTLTFVVTPLVGAFVGYWIATWILGVAQPRAALLTWRGALSVLAVASIITVVLLAIFIPRERAARAEARAARDEARINAAEREATLARMRLLNAQVEPHFLYNTLAHVMSLVDGEPALAKRMLHRLIDLLRATAMSQQADSTVRSQTALLHAYLELIAIRMGRRLAWSIDVEPGLEDLPMPPMLLQPVAENAIKHGLEPRIEGGRVDVRVQRQGDGLVVTVADSGLGVASTRDARSTGLGLPNLRARLAALYGSAAALTLADNVPHGTVVTIAMPAEAAR